MEKIKNEIFMEENIFSDSMSLGSESSLEVVSKEDLSAINLLKNTIQVLTFQKQAAELSLENTILKIYLKYRLNERDEINETTGIIIRK